MAEINRSIALRKAAFLRHHDLYRLTCTLFGLQNALGSFQHTTNVFSEIEKWQFVLRIFWRHCQSIQPKSAEKPIRQNQEVKTPSSNAAVTLLFKECTFFIKTIDVLWKPPHAFRNNFKHNESNKRNIWVKKIFKMSTRSWSMQFFLRKYDALLAPLVAHLNSKLKKDWPL